MLFVFSVFGFFYKLRRSMKYVFVWILCTPQALRAHYVTGIYSRERNGSECIMSLNKSLSRHMYIMHSGPLRFLE